jgi:segregation and condensation protein A
MKEIPAEMGTDQSGGQKYIIHIDNFDGPLDLLWDLIRRSKIDITEISISSITEQYIQYLKLMEKMNISIASEFIVMASDLLYYKSMAILPSAEIDDEYFVQPLPPDLIQKLLEYKKFQATSRKLEERFLIQSDCFARDSVLDVDVDDVYIEVSLFDLLNAFVDVIDSRQAFEQEEIVFDEILVTDRIDYINSLFDNRDCVIFQDIFTGRINRSEVVVSFIAILEMAKTGKVRLLQHRVFGDIKIFRN